MPRTMLGLESISHKICDLHIWTRDGTKDFLGRQSRQGQSILCYANMLQSLDPDG